MLTKLQSFKEEREEGFTLIELLVVILIIGILSAIAIPAFLNQRKSAVDSSVQSDVSNAAKQVETWIVKQGAQANYIPRAGTVAEKTAAGAIGQIKVSDGTTLTIRGSSFHYTIEANNPGGDVANVTGIYYDSSKGGMQKMGSAAPTPPTTASGGIAPGEAQFTNVG